MKLQTLTTAVTVVLVLIGGALLSEQDRPKEVVDDTSDKPTPIVVHVKSPQLERTEDPKDCCELVVEQAPNSTAVLLDGTSVVGATHDELMREVFLLRSKVSYLETELELASAGYGPLSQWSEALNGLEVVSREEMRAIGDIVRNIPITYTTEEALWVLDRFRKDDWESYGETIEEAMLLRFGIVRVVKSVDPITIRRLQRSYPSLFR